MQSLEGLGGESQSKARSGKQAADFVGGQILDAKQVKWLNDTLKQEQVRNRQLGAVDTSLLNAYSIDGGAAQSMAPQIQIQEMDVQFERGQVAELQRQALQPQNFGLQTPTAGSGGGAQGYWVSGGQGVAGGGDGHLAARAENVFLGTSLNPNGVPFGVNAEPSSVGTSRDAGLFYADGQDGDARGVARGKAGTMGVDVELPRSGRVYYFRSMSGAAPIVVEADKSGRPLASRVILLMFLLAAAGVAAHQLRRVGKARAS